MKYGAELLGVESEDLEIGGGKIWVKGNPEKCAGIYDIAQSGKYRRKGRQILGSGYYDPSSEVPDTQGKGNKSGTYAFGVQAVEVAVDPETGEVTVLRMAASHDIGKALNPSAVEGQIEGSLVPGAGLCTLRRDGLFRKGESHQLEFPRLSDPHGGGYAGADSDTGGD